MDTNKTFICSKMNFKIHSSLVKDALEREVANWAGIFGPDATLAHKLS